MIIIGITGTLGAGKGTIVDYLLQKKHFEHYSVRAFLIDEIKKRNIPVNRDSMVSVANELRQKHHPGYIVEELYKLAVKNKKNAVIESIRTPGEIDLLQDKENFYLLAVDATAELRYNRIKLRQSETDHITFDTFIENEKREMFNEDPNKQNLSICIKRADFIIKNDGTIDELYIQLESIFQLIKK